MKRITLKDGGYNWCLDGQGVLCKSTLLDYFFIPRSAKSIDVVLSHKPMAESFKVVGN